MLEIRALVVFTALSTLSACAAVEEFSFQDIYDDFVALVIEDSETSVTDSSDESANLEEDHKPEIAPEDNEPASWLIKNGCKLNSVAVDAGGTRTWKLRCPNSRWVTLVDSSLQ